MDRQHVTSEGAKRVGRAGEDIAAEELRTLGMNIVEQNAHIGRSGELDIIAMDGQVLVFVEVKTRKGDWMGKPEESVNEAKQKQLKRLARMWIHRHGMYGLEVRFDVVAVEMSEGNTEVRYLPNAFW